MILVLKMTKKYHITWYWCQNIRENMVEKRVKKFGQGSPPPPLFGQCPKENIFFFRRASHIHKYWSSWAWSCKTKPVEKIPFCFGKPSQHRIQWREPGAKVSFGSLWQRLKYPLIKKQVKRHKPSLHVNHHVGDLFNLHGHHSHHRLWHYLSITNSQRHISKVLRSYHHS